MNELELRQKLAERTARDGNAQARQLCAVGSRHCRAGEPEEWLELEHGGRTFAFCAAHSLAAEVLAGERLLFVGLSPLDIVGRIGHQEARRG